MRLSLPERDEVFWFMLAVLVLILLPLVICMHCQEAQGAELIDVGAIIHIESRGNSDAYNKDSGAIGLMQITPIVLQEYNQFNETTYSLWHLYHPELNKEIGVWYLTVRIPQLLRKYKKTVNSRNILISYNAGIKYVLRKKGKDGKYYPRKLPTETIKYIEQYNKLVS